MPRTTTPDTTGRAAGHYTTARELADLVQEHRDTGEIPEALVLLLMKLVGGCWDRYRFTSDREEFVQEVVLHLIQRPLEKADVQKSCFNYFTTCTIRHGWKLRDKEQGDRRRFQTYAEELAESGRDIPGRE